MKTNEELQKDVQEAIKWEPQLHAAEIGVTVKNGVVSLSGIVDSYTKKLEAENAAKNVSGVKAIVENIEIKFSNSSVKSDNEVANEVINALKWSWTVPDEKIKIKVEEGWVSLTGEVNWNYQKDAAKNAIKNIIGVKGVSNNIEIKSENKKPVEKKDIENALNRNWSINSDDIDVDVVGNTVKLTGKVDSYYEKDEAERMAWNAPGVWSVDNQLAIGYFS